MTFRPGRARSSLLAWLAFFLVLPLSQPRGDLSAAQEVPRWEGADEKAPSPREDREGILSLLGLEPSADSVDYVRNKTQFQLHNLLTEQRHPKTLDFSERVQEDTLAGLRMLAAVDEDVRAKLEAIAADTRSLEDAAAAVEAAILARKKIYIYGCGATGRLAKQMESAFWRPFWRRVRADGKIWPNSPRHFPRPSRTSSPAR